MEKAISKKRVTDYWHRMYELRYFLWHLVKLDLRNKFRRSKLGIIWTFLSPLLLTVIMAVVFSVAFHNDIKTYAPYILTGILFWELFSGSFQAGGYAIISNQFYIRQCSHPYSFYTLKSALVFSVTFLIAMISLLVWLAFINPMGILMGLAFLIPALLIYFTLSWAATTIAAYICAKYRDYPLMIPLILQTLWYVSPVFLQESMFMNNEVLLTWFNINPITHLLRLIRYPFLECRVPSLENYLVSIAFTLIVCGLAWIISKKNGKEIVFYL